MQQPDGTVSITRRYLRIPITHYMRPFTADEYIRYSGEVGRVTRLRGKGRHYESDTKGGKLAEIKLKWWRILCEGVVDCALYPKEVMGQPWKDIVPNRTPQVCIDMVDFMDSTEEDDNDESPFRESGSENASDIE